MSEKRKSKEEIFLYQLHKLASETGDPEAEIDRYIVAEVFSGNPKSVDNIVQVLTKNNFIKKSEGNLIYLTPLGIVFINENFG